MNAFTTTAATFLSRYTDSLLKEECEAALSGRTLYDLEATSASVDSIVALMDSFTEDDYLICGLHRTNGSVAQQQKITKMLEGIPSLKLKRKMLNDLTAEDRAGSLRLLLRRMPEPLFPYCQRAVIADIADSVRTGRLCAKSALKTLQILVYYLPTTAKRCLNKLIGHFQLIVANSTVNRMGIENVALIFASSIFPISENPSCTELVKADIENICQLFPILLYKSDELFHLPDEFIDTLESSIQKHVDENRAWECASPILREDPELVMTETSSNRMTPTQSTTNLELARLMATISSMPEGSAKAQLIRRLKQSQRCRLGITKKSNIFSKLIHKARR